MARNALWLGRSRGEQVLRKSVYQVTSFTDNVAALRMKLRSVSSVGGSPGLLPQISVFVELGDMKQLILNSGPVTPRMFRKSSHLLAARGASPAVKGASLRSAGLRLLRSLRPLPLR